MGVCDDILKKDIVPSCDDPVVQGLEQEGVIMNRADVDFAATVFNSTKKNVIESLVSVTTNSLEEGENGEVTMTVTCTYAQPAAVDSNAQ